MELRQLEQFVAVAELSSFTRAGQRLHVVQSAVSASVQALERELGARLFERGPRGVRLTPAGSALLPAARHTLDAARTAREAVTRIATGVAGEVHLGTMASIDVIDLPALLARLRHEHPGITVRLRTSPTGSGGLTEELARGDLDAALVANDGSPVPGMRLTHVVTVPIVALLRSDHPLADRPAVALAELADEQFIDFPVGFGNRRIVDDAFTRLRLPRSVAVEVTDVTHAAAYVRHGLGISLIPGLPNHQPGGEVRSIVVHRPDLPWVLSIGVSATRTTSAATRALLDLVPAYTQAIVPGPRATGGTDATSNPASPR
jgi:DNA-binding transcriptional LysR family regulator